MDGRFYSQHRGFEFKAHFGIFHGLALIYLFYLQNFHLIETIRTKIHFWNVNYVPSFYATNGINWFRGNELINILKWRLRIDNSSFSEIERDSAKDNPRKHTVT